MADTSKIEAAIAKFKSAVLGREVRQAMVDIGEAVKDAVEGQIVDLDDGSWTAGKAADAGDVGAFIKVDSVFDWSTIGSTAYPNGFEPGYYSQNNGGKYASQQYLRTIAKIAFDADSIRIVPPTGYAVGVVEYDENGDYVRSVGSISAANTSAELNVTAGYTYSVTFGKFTDSDAAARAQDSAFINSFVCTMTTPRWANDLDAIREEVDDELNDAAAALSGADITPVMEQGTFNSSSWKEVASDAYIRTAEDIYVYNMGKVSYSVTGDVQRVYCCARYTDGTHESLGYKSALDGTFILGANTERIRIMLYNADGITPEDATLTISFGSADEENTSYVSKTAAAAFKRFAVYSDSLASGRKYLYSEYIPGTQPNIEGVTMMDDKSQSWPVFMARYLNNTVYNHSQHGESSDVFITGLDYWNGTGGTSVGDNCLSCACDGNHDVPMSIIAFASNNHNDRPAGSIADINTADCTMNADTVYGWRGRLIQMISNYYAGIDTPQSSVSGTRGSDISFNITVPGITGRSEAAEHHIIILIYGYYSTGMDVSTQVTKWGEIVDLLGPVVEAQGNHLHLIVIPSDDMDNSFFRGDVRRVHWTGVGYCALGELIANQVSTLIWDNPDKFQMVDWNPTNQYITTYSNPSNYT